MARWGHYYVIRLQFLGFRYHGWQKQEGLKTVHGMVDKTMAFVLGHQHFRTLGCSRTDAKVSADDYAFELFINDEQDVNKLVSQLNRNFPGDIRALSAMPVSSDFNIIQSVSKKEYHYHFSFGEKPHPNIAPLVCYLGDSLAIEDMIHAATFFTGTHDFRCYCAKPSEDANFEREIFSSEIIKNSNWTGTFMPANSYTFKVVSSGFLRYQVRLMMGALIDTGMGISTVSELKESLNPDQNASPIRRVAPSSGLRLHRVSF